MGVPYPCVHTLYVSRLGEKGKKRILEREQKNSLDAFGYLGRLEEALYYLGLFAVMYWDLGSMCSVRARTKI